MKIPINYPTTLVIEVKLLFCNGWVMDGGGTNPLEMLEIRPHKVGSYNTVFLREDTCSLPLILNCKCKITCYVIIRRNSIWKRRVDTLAQLAAGGAADRHADSGMCSRFPVVFVAWVGIDGKSRREL
jgi:hypothetical protein